MIIGALTGYSDPKRRPAPHRLEHILTKQHSGFYIARLPRPYPLSAPQRHVRDVAKACGIHKGISRGELVRAMIECVSGHMRKG